MRLYTSRLILGGVLLGELLFISSYRGGNDEVDEILKLLFPEIELNELLGRI